MDTNPGAGSIEADSTTVGFGRDGGLTAAWTAPTVNSDVATKRTIDGGPRAKEGR
jgi:hypothetical protein